MDRKPAGAKRGGDRFQLAIPPELIAWIAAELVFFADPDVQPGSVRWKRLRPKPTSSTFSHDLSPEELPSWTVALFQAGPKTCGS